MRKLIIIRPGKHAAPGRMTSSGRGKCQVAETETHIFCLVFAFTQIRCNLTVTLCEIYVESEDCGL